MENVLLHDAGGVSVGGEGIAAAVFAVDDSADPDIHRRNACPAVGEEADAACTAAVGPLPPAAPAELLILRLPICRRYSRSFPVTKRKMPPGKNHLRW